jgi:hypothetical protein
MKRTVGALALAGVMAFGGFGSVVVAQGVTVSGSTAPGAVLAAQAELAVLDVSVSPTAIEGIPATLAAGRYALNVSASPDLDFGGGVEFVQPVGISAEEFMAMAVPQAGEGDAAASPAAESGEEMGAPPAAL